MNTTAPKATKQRARRALGMAGMLAVWACMSAQAQTAQGCVRLGVKSDAQSMTNACGERIVVFWCHDSPKSDSFYRGGVCGTEGKFYRKSWVMEPGDVMSNVYSHPLGSRLTYGACFGSYSSYETLDDKGTYRCKPLRTGSGDQAVWTATAGAGTRDEACQHAQRMAAEQRANPGECSCTETPGHAVCKVQYSAPKGDAPVTAPIKQELRERLKCDPKTTTCPPHAPTVPTGVRG